MRIRTLLFSFSFYISAQAALKPAGTASRQEVEYKTAFLNKDLKVESLLLLLENKLRIQAPKLKLADSLSSKAFVESKFKEFVFKDFYFDSAEDELLSKGISYRLRYRFTDPALYYRHYLFPFLKNFYPNRAEIQLKHSYQNKGKFFTVNETRFEFRNESEPFIHKQDAPPPPWPKDEYIGYATTGAFRSYHVLPHFELRKMAKSAIKPVLELVTHRYRNHINIKNPFGSGPNPTQVFIISLDRVLKEGREAFFEFEVEIDRNFLTNIQRTARGEFPRFEGLDIFAKNIEEVARQDLLTIQNLIRNLLKEQPQLKLLDPMSKYQRGRK